MKDNNQIKAEYQEALSQIKAAKEKIADLQNICPHEHSRRGFWTSEKQDVYLPARICDYCGFPVKFI